MTAGRRRAFWFAAALLAGAFTVYGIRFVPFFEVRRVEVHGLRYLDPLAVVESLGIEPNRNLFAPLGALQARAVAFPGVASVEVRRRMPGTLSFVIRERVPVALLAGTDGLVPLAADAATLPFDPIVSGLSLPLVVVADTTVLRVLSLVRALDSTLFTMIDAAEPAGRAVVLTAGSRRVTLHADLGASDFVGLQAVRRDLTERAESFEEIDTRFDGWVVVRREGT